MRISLPKQKTWKQEFNEVRDSIAIAFISAVVGVWLFFRGWK